MMRRVLAVFACLVALPAAAGCGSTPPAPSPTPGGGIAIARVGSSVITQAAFATRLQSTLVSIEQGGGSTSSPAMQASVRASVLRSLILDAIIAQEAAGRGLAASAAEVQAQVAADASSVGGLSTLEAQLASAGGSLAQLEDELRSQINEQRLEDAFASQRALQVEQQLGAGASFATVAEQMSDDTGTSSKGGDLGAITPSDFSSYDASFLAAMQALAVGAYTKTPVHDAGGYDILQLYARTSSSWSVRHILVAAPQPYTVTDRPAWFSEALFVTVTQLCGQGQIHLYATNDGGDPCAGAPTLQPSPAASPG